MLKVDIKSDVKKFNEQFKEFQGNLQNFTEVNRRIAFWLLQRTYKNFQATVDPNGKKWPRIKQREDGSDVPLNDTGQLRNSIKIEYNAKFAKVGSTLFYAQTHNMGRGKIKQREFIPNQLTKSYQQNITKIIKMMLTDDTQAVKDQNYQMLMAQSIGSVGSFSRGNQQKMQRAVKRRETKQRQKANLANKRRKKEETKLKRKERADKQKIKRQAQNERKLIKKQKLAEKNQRQRVRDDKKREIAKRKAERLTKKRDRDAKRQAKTQLRLDKVKQRAEKKRQAAQKKQDKIKTRIEKKQQQIYAKDAKRKLKKEKAKVAKNKRVMREYKKDLKKKNLNFVVYDQKLVKNAQKRANRKYYTQKAKRTMKKKGK